MLGFGEKDITINFVSKILTFCLLYLPVVQKVRFIDCDHLNFTLRFLLFICTNSAVFDLYSDFLQRMFTIALKFSNS